MIDKDGIERPDDLHAHSRKLVLGKRKLKFDENYHFYPRLPFRMWAGFFRTFFVIVFPLAKPGLATGAILQFLTSWNEFMFALILTKSTNVRTLPLALNYFTSQFSFNYTAMFAALTMVILPSIIIYILLQEQITSSMVEGSVKG